MHRYSQLVVLFLVTTLVVSFADLPSKVCASCPEDVNGDSVVTIEDIVVVAKAFASYPGHSRWNSKADVDGDGEVSIADIIAIAMKLGTHVPQLVVSVNIHPESLNLRSRGRWITVNVVFPKNYNVSEVDGSTILLNNTLAAEIIHVDPANNTLLVKFNRAALATHILSGANLSNRFTAISLTVSGTLGDASFLGTDSIKVIAIDRQH